MDIMCTVVESIANLEKDVLGALIAACITGGVALLVAVATLTISIITIQQNKRISEANINSQKVISQEDRDNHKNISKANIKSQEQILKTNVASQIEITNTRNALDVITKARKEWLSRLKLNASKYLSIVKKANSQYSPDELEDTGELWGYTYLVLSDLNIFDDADRKIKILIELINKTIETRNSVIDKLKIETNDSGKVSYLSVLEALNIDISGISEELAREKYDKKLARLIMETKCISRCLMLKFLQLYKVEWQRIKQESEGKTYNAKDEYAIYDNDIEKEFAKYCKKSTTDANCSKYEDCKIRQYFSSEIMND